METKVQPEEVKRKTPSRKGKRVSPSQKEREEIKEKAKKADEYFDQLLRLKADFENYRKRVEKEKMQWIEFAAEELIYELLPVMDNLERAVIAAKENQNPASLIEGVEMTKKEMFNLLKKGGLEKIESVGKEFDPNLHDAIMQVESEDKDDIVVEEVQRGYSLKGKVLRPAKVKVAKKSSK